MDNKRVVVDLENFDPNLQTLGAGSIRKDGSILVAGLYDGNEYTPCRIGEPSWDKLKDVLADKSITKIAHNGIYDYDWLQNGTGLQLAGNLEDTMTRAGLIDEFAGQYGLDACCEREGVGGKNQGDTIDSWWASVGGQGDAMKNLMLFPKDIVEKYNKQDCVATWDLFHAQQPKLERMSLLDINQLECDVLPPVLEMRKNGIRVDIPKIDELRRKTEQIVAEGMKQLADEYGLTSLTERKTAGSLPMVLKRLGLADQLEQTGNNDISVSADSLLGCDHPITTKVIELKRKQTLLTKYLNSAFTDFVIGDRIHGTFKPTQRDDGGTITGRFSSSCPNMQNFSAREYKDGDLVRGVFIPDEGCWLAKLDYSQIEYRLLAHYAVGPGATALRDSYARGDADYHQLAMDLLGWKGKDMRRVVKNFNFGMIYGMGLNTFKQKFKLEARKAAAEMGMTTDAYTTHYYNEYMRRMTFVKPTVMAIQAMAQRDKGVRSIGGRWHHGPPDGTSWYKMTNYLIQGSAADINKMGLRDAWKQGIFKVLKVHLTVHDETVCSVPKTKEGLEAVEALQRCMCDCVRLKVPVIVEPGIARNWFIAGETPGHMAYLGMRKKLGLAV